MRRLPLIGLLLIAGAAPQAQAAPGAPQTMRFTYAPSTPAGSGLERPVRRLDTPAGRVAAFAQLEVVPSGRSLTLTLHDLGALDGQTLDVQLRQGTVRTDRCVPVRQPTTFTGLRPGSAVTIWIRSDLDAWIVGPCTGHSAGGTAYVQL